LLGAGTVHHITNRLVHRNKQLRGCAPSEGVVTPTNKDKEAAN
jgi:hypothetical protein